MIIKQHEIIIKTEGRGMEDITHQLNEVVKSSHIEKGICHLLIKHTSASLMISENADDNVKKDIESFFSRMVPDGDPLFRHVEEGEDDMSSHLRSILTKTELTLPITNGTLNLGIWQGIFLYEHRYASHKRKISMTMIGSIE